MPPKYGFSAVAVLQSGRVRQKNFDSLKSWHVAEKLPLMSDEQLILFLIACDDNVQAAQNTVIAYFKSKQAAPELFYNRNLDGEDLQDIAEAWTRDNEVIMFGRLRDPSVSKFDVDRLVKLSWMVSELPFHQDPPAGIVSVIDLQGVTLRHLIKIRPGTVRKTMRYVQEGYPCKIRQVHVLNTVSFIDKLLRLLKPFMKPELLEMMQFHTSDMDMNDFFDRFLPRDCMPQDYGGNLPPLQSLCTDTYNALRQLQKFYKDEEAQIKSFNNT